MVRLEGEVAGVVPVPRVGDQVQDDIADREVGGADPEHPRSRQLLERVASVGEVARHAFARKEIEPVVEVGVARHLVTLRHDPPDERGVAPSHPPQYEERRPGPDLRQDIEELVRVPLDPSLQGVPIGPWEAGLHVLGVEPVLRVERCEERGGLGDRRRTFAHPRSQPRGGSSHLPCLPRTASVRRLRAPGSDDSV